MWDWINSLTEDFENKYIMEPGNEYIKDTTVGFLSDVGTSVWHWFVQSLPDIAGYGMMAAGVGVILSSMAGRGMMKPLGYLAGGLIVAVCILEVA